MHPWCSIGRLHWRARVVVEHPEITKAMMEEIMVTRPVWAEKLGVPIAAEAWVGKRYRK